METKNEYGEFSDIWHYNISHGHLAYSGPYELNRYKDRYLAVLYMLKVGMNRYNKERGKER